MTGYRVRLQQRTLSNSAYRRVLYTGPKAASMQLVLMSLKPGQDIGWETHPQTTQFLRVEGGRARVHVGQSRYQLGPDDAAIIPAGARHNVVNIGNTDLQLYTLYSRQEHPRGAVQKVKTE